MLVDLNMSLLVGGTLLALILSLAGIILGAIGFMKALSTEKATHTVQFVSPFDTPEKREENKELASEAMDVWADSEKDINKINRADKETLDDEIFL